MSKLDPAVYGPPESAITKDLIEQELHMHRMSVEEVLICMHYHISRALISDTSFQSINMWHANRVEVEGVALWLLTSINSL